MFTLILFLILAGIIAGCWFQGLWSCAINVINLTFAAMLATNFWEPASNMLDEQAGKDYTYVYDFLALWIIFAISYALLRAITNALSEHHVEFHKYVELAGRSILSFWCGWVFLCFTCFTLQTAPIPASPFGAWASPGDAAFLGFEPDVYWASFAQNRSRFAFARTKSSESNAHPDDAELNVETFDPQADFVARYHDRRAKFEKMDALGS